jgi:hypothetical protein
MLKSKFSLSRHFEYANEQITYHFWLCIILNLALKGLNGRGRRGMLFFSELIE